MFAAAWTSCVTGNLSRPLPVQASSLSKPMLESINGLHRKEPRELFDFTVCYGKSDWWWWIEVVEQSLMRVPKDRWDRVQSTLLEVLSRRFHLLVLFLRAGSICRECPRVCQFILPFPSETQDPISIRASPLVLQDYCWDLPAWAHLQVWA